MNARVLVGEIDAIRMSVEEAVNVVRGSVVPALWATARLVTTGLRLTRQRQPEAVPPRPLAAGWHSR